MQRRAVLLTLVFVGCPDEHELAKRPATPPASVAIKNVAVLDVVTGSIAPGRTVVVREGRIAQIVASTETVEAERVIDGSGKTLLPGLIDTHGHTASASHPPWEAGMPDADTNLVRYVYSGVTHVFDPGGHDEDVFERRRAIEEGELLGPRLSVAGPVFTTPGGHPRPMFELSIPSFLAWYLVPHLIREVDTPEAAKTAVDELIDTMKPDIVKFVVDQLPPGTPRIDPKVAAAITEAANAKGVRTVAHIGTTTDAIDAGRAGVAGWIHGVYKERISDADIARIAAFDIPMAPTLIVFDSYATLGFERREASKLEKEMLSEKQLRSFDKVSEDFDVDAKMEELVKILQGQRQDSLDNVRRLHAAGVTILAGSDAQPGVFHGPGLHRELRLLEQAGLPRIEVIRATTLYAARFLTDTKDPSYGVIAVGKDADLILVDGNPLEDLGALERIEEVVLRGVPLVRSPLP